MVFNRTFLARMAVPLFFDGGEAAFELVVLEVRDDLINCGGF